MPNTVYKRLHKTKFAIHVPKDLLPLFDKLDDFVNQKKALGIDTTRNREILAVLERHFAKPITDLIQEERRRLDL